MNHMLITLRGRKVVLTRLDNTAYGNIATGMLMSWHMGRIAGAAVHLIRPRRPLNTALFELIPEGVELLASRTTIVGARLYCQGLSMVQSVFSILARLLAALAWLRDRSRRRVAGNETGPGRIEMLISELSARAAGITKSVGRPFYYGIDFRYHYARSPIKSHLPEAMSLEAGRQAEQLGISPDARIVTLHVRESGYKLGRGEGDRDKRDTDRNAKIATYFPAIDHLVNEGYTVIRIGDPSMTPVARRGLIDLATLPLRTDLLELSVLARSRFFIGCDSGVYWASLLTNTPCLFVNCINVVGMYPLRVKDMYILKRPYNMNTGRAYSLIEMLTDDYLFKIKNQHYCGFIDNTADDILEAVREMISSMDGNVAFTDAQQKFRSMIEDFMAGSRARAKYMGKAGIEKVFSGDGRICSFFAEKYMTAGVMAP